MADRKASGVSDVLHPVIFAWKSLSVGVDIAILSPYLSRSRSLIYIWRLYTFGG